MTVLVYYMGLYFIFFAGFVTMTHSVFGIQARALSPPFPRGGQLKSHAFRRSDTRLQQHHSHHPHAPAGAAGLLRLRGGLREQQLLGTRGACVGEPMPVTRCNRSPPCSHMSLACSFAQIFITYIVTMKFVLFNLLLAIFNDSYAEVMRRREEETFQLKKEGKYREKVRGGRKACARCSVA